MADDPPGERRGTSDVLSDLRVAVGEIRTTVNAQTKTLDRLEERLNVAILRDEFIAYKVATEHERDGLRQSVEGLTRAHERKIGSDNVWRLVFSGALAILTVVIAVAGVLVAAHTGALRVSP